jgi:hypothetical protein
MPLPFGDEHANFTRYSLSTKMVTYVGSGVPVLYHGPTNSAAFELLKQNDAAVFVTTLNPEDVANTLGQLDDSTRRTVSANALRLAKRQFMLADQTRTFWETVGRFVSLR